MIPVSLTPARRTLDALAQLLAQRNADAAEELGWRLVHHAQQRQRPRWQGGIGVEIRLNGVTGRLELRTGE